MSTTEIPWLSFSSVDLIESLGGSLNPLGLQTSQIAISNIFFPQFTTLTNEIRNHNILCGLLLGLKENNIEITPKSIRKAENLWGWLQTSLIVEEKADIDSPLNIQKYTEIYKSQKGLINSQKWFQGRLSYGLYGFHIQPSIKWGLVEKDGKTLTSQGTKLAEAFYQDSKFNALLKRWLSEETIDFRNKHNLKYAKQCSLVQMGEGEQNCWKEIIKEYVRSTSYFKNLWDLLPTSGSITSNTLKGIYKVKSTEIVERIEFQQRFEKVYSLSNFFFDLLYYYAEEKENLTKTNVKPPVIFDLLKDDFQKHLKAFNDKDKFKTPEAVLLLNMNLTDFDSFFSSILGHHRKIQQMKAKSAYFDENFSVLQYGQENFDLLKKVLIHDKGISLETIQEIYKVDWRFGRASNYKKMIYGKK